MSKDQDYSIVAANYRPWSHSPSFLSLIRSSKKELFLGTHSTGRLMNGKPSRPSVSQKKKMMEVLRT